MYFQLECESGTFSWTNESFSDITAASCAGSLCITTADGTTAETETRFSVRQSFLGAGGQATSCEEFGHRPAWTEGVKYR